MTTDRRPSVTGIRHDLHCAARNAERAGREAKAQALGFPEYSKAPTWTCPECGTTLELTGYSWRVDQVELCDCVEQAGRDAYAAYRAEHRPAAVAAAWQAVGVPARFRDKTLDSFVRRKGAETAHRACSDYAASFDPETTTAGLLLLGRYGSGKTHLAIGIVRALVDRLLIDPMVVGADELVTRHQESGFETGELQRACRAQLLLLDDLGQGRASDFRRDTLYRVVDDRYRAQLPTLITSNLGDSELAALFGGAFVSRLAEMCAVVPINASDYRLELAKVKVA